MNPLRVLVCTAICAAAASCTSIVEEPARANIEDAFPGHDLIARFEGHYPCGEIDPTEECDRLKVWLFLYVDEDTREPSEYNFGYIAVGGFNDERTTWEGFWSLERGRPGFPEAEVIVLDANAPPFFREQWRVDGHLLLLLDEYRHVLPGHPEGGYTLYNYTMQLIRTLSTS